MAMERVEWEERAAGPSPAQGFVGRQWQLSELRAAYDAAAAGRGQLCLLSGEAGIGKSRLASLLAAEGTAAGATVLWGRCPEEGYAPPFWPWTQALRSYARSADTAAMAARLGPSAARVAQLDPELADRLGVRPASASPDSGRARLALFDGVARFLEAAGKVAPVVVVLDDLQGADEGSLLSAALRRPRTAPQSRAHRRHLP